ncbi:MAG TPA: NAD(P)/FAD-dependent oxidoreductase [Bacillota bacterium]|nr:NAD(P)/FAD-dependent oxidoreductase [Bacillota bacterium]
MSSPKIVILGAGYGGIITAVRLQKKLRANEAEVTLVNKNEYHYQSTALHESSAGTLHHDRTRVKIKDVVNFNKINFVQAEVISIQPDEKKVTLANGDLEYDYLVIGLGFESATFGIPGLKEYAFSITNINSARLIREHIEYNFAKFHNEVEKQQSRLNIVVGGAGFTGIEFVGELANRIPELCKEYDIDRAQVRIINVEGAPTIMPGFHPDLIEYAQNSLEARGVEFITGAMLQECTPEGIIYEKDGEKHEIPTKTLVWAAGVKANSIVEESGFETNRGKIEVTPELRAPDYDDVFVVGDCALVMNEETGNPYPPTAQIAIQHADTVADNLLRIIRGNDELKTFEPVIRGTVASLGHNDAVGEVFGRNLYGWPATVMKKAIDNRYLLKLGGLGLMFKKGKLNVFY